MDLQRTALVGRHDELRDDPAVGLSGRWSTPNTGQVRPVALQPCLPPVADRGTHASALLVTDDEHRPVGGGLIACAIRGSVVHDDRLEPAVQRHLVEDTADLPCLMESRDDDGNDGQDRTGFGMRQVLRLY